MAKIKVTSKCAIYDGMIMTFKAPCDCTIADGINVYFQNDKQTFFFRDAHGNDVSEIDDLFKKDAYVTVSLDTTNGCAFLQNADTNAYLEEALTDKADKTHGHKLTDSGITGTLPVSKGGTGANNAETARTNLGAAPADHNHSTADITSGTLPCERGGTGRNFSDLPAYAIIRATSNSEDYPYLYYTATGNGAFYATATNGSPKFGTLPLAQGGTGATDTETARSNLGAAAESHNHAASNITSGTLGIARGGTGKATHTSNAVLTGNGTSAVNNVATASGALYATAANGAPKFGTLPLAQGGTGATSASAARTKLEVAPAKPHSSYANNYYRTVDSTTEWINPPMVLGTEYRTHERWNGKVLYTKLLDCGSITDGTTVNYSTETVKPVRFAGFTSGGIALPIFLENPTGSTWRCWLDVKNNEIMLHCGSSYGTVHVYVQIWYTKG